MAPNARAVTARTVLHALKPAGARFAAPLFFPLVEVEDDAEPVDEPVEEPDVLPLMCLASPWNAVKLFGPLSIALMENTMPEPQWSTGFVCAQKPQMGAVSFTVILNVVWLAVAEASMGMKPELKPETPPSGTQGLAKLLRVTVWFFGLKKKVTVSPMDAEMFDGLKASWPFAPTVIWWSIGFAVGVGAACRCQSLNRHRCLHVTHGESPGRTRRLSSRCCCPRSQ